MKYHSGRRFGLDEIRQSKIYWTCLNYGQEPENVRRSIDDAIREIGGICSVPLRQAVLTKDAVTDISIRYAHSNTPIDSSNLARKVKAVYLRLDRVLS